MSDDVTARLNSLAARWEHGHAEFTAGCALCQEEFAAVMAVVHGPDAAIKGQECDKTSTMHWFGECPRCQMCVCGEFWKTCVCEEGER